MRGVCWREVLKRLRLGVWGSKGRREDEGGKLSGRCAHAYRTLWYKENKQPLRRDLPLFSAKCGLARVTRLSVLECYWNDSESLS